MWRLQRAANRKTVGCEYIITNAKIGPFSYLLLFFFVSPVPTIFLYEFLWPNRMQLYMSRRSLAGSILWPGRFRFIPKFGLTIVANR